MNTDYNRAPVERRAMPQFVCTQCRLKFYGADESGANATCPKCGEKYGHLFTKLIRCGTFDLAHWLRDCPGDIREHA